jgi:hypothetical protein
MTWARGVDRRLMIHRECVLASFNRPIAPFTRPTAVEAKPNVMGSLMVQFYYGVHFTRR